MFWDAFVVTAFFRAFPEVAAFSIVLTNVNGFNFFTVAIWAGWFWITWSFNAFDLIVSGTFASGAWSKTPSSMLSSVFTVIVTVASSAWDLRSSQLIVPAVESSASLHVIFVSTWWKDLAVWKLAVTVLWGDTCFQVRQNHTFGTLNRFFWFAKINTSGKVVLTLSKRSLHGVTSLVAFEGAENFVFFIASDWWGSSDTAWWGHGGIFWGGWSVDSSVPWAWKTDTLDLSMHAVTRGASIRLAGNFFSFGVFDTIDFSTETFLLFQALSSVFRKDGVIDTGTTFNADFLTFFLDLIPASDVSASQWTSGNTWRVLSTTVTLHWTKSLVSPSNIYTFIITGLSISGNSGTETFTFSTGVTGTGIVLTVLEVVIDIDVGVAFGEWTILVFQN